MSYKAILVHVDESRHVEQRIEVAAHIAQRENAHLIGAAVTGISKITGELVTRAEDRHGEATEANTPEGARKRAGDVLDNFERIVRKLGIASFEKRLIDDEAATGIAVQGLCSDLIVLGQSDVTESSLTSKVDFPEYVTLNCGCPVLIVPCSRRSQAVGERVLIAWNASMASARAVRSALPLLKRAKCVELAEIHSTARPLPNMEEPHVDVPAYLARHGIKAEVIRQTTESNAGEAILSLAVNQSSDLIVMGCVAHPRYAGVLLGGATRAVLEAMTVPVLMSH